MYKLKFKLFENRIKEYININYFEEGKTLYFQKKNEEILMVILKFLFLMNSMLQKIV